MTSYCCETFQEAVEKAECIRWIDNYQMQKNPWEKQDIKTTRGYYLINEYAEKQMALRNNPAIKTKLNLCPWCGTKF